MNFATLKGLTIPKVPAGYTQVEYIQSSGTQYIDTGFKPNQDTRVVMDVQAIAASGTLVYFGVRQTQKVKSFLLFKINDTSLRSDYGNTSASIAVTTYTDRVIIDADSGVTKYGDLSVTHTAETFQSDYPLALLALRTRDKINSQMHAKLYSCQVYDNGTLIRDFVPCKNASGAVGLYDLVNDVFYDNAGSGTFTAGAESSCVVKQITDAAGNVLWSAFIKFTMNGETYVADRGMTWAAWFASSYNTTGETKGDIKDANGNEVSMDAVIVGGTAYEVGFGPSTAIVTITGYSSEYYVSVSIDGTKYYSATTIEVPIGTVVECSAYTDDPVYLGAAIYVNGEKVANSSDYPYKNLVTYSYTVTCNATINLIEEYRGSWSPYGYFTRIEITEET